MFPFDLVNVILGDIPVWLACLIAGLAFGLNAGAFIIRRKYLRLFNLWDYEDDALEALIEWAAEVLQARQDERDKEICECGDRLVDCSTCPQRDGSSDSHGQSGSGATGSIPACGAGDEGSSPSSGTIEPNCGGPQEHTGSCCVEGNPENHEPGKEFSHHGDSD